jgi:amino acid adenylation domain-containing protein
MDVLIHQLLSRSAERYPDRVAIEDGERRMTYAELDARANQLANLLRDTGVSRGDRVGLYLDKSLEAVAGIYGILKTGAAYVPLDPRAPTRRLAYMAADCGIRVLVTGAEKSDAWRSLRAEGAPIDALVVANADEADPGEEAVRLLTSADIDARSQASPAGSGIGLDLAYILYTSGSTGDPKGVMLSHMNALTFVRWAVEEFGISANDRLSNHAPYHFDLTILDLYAAAAAGATLVLVPSELSLFPVLIRDFIREKRLTVWYSVPSILTMLMLRGGIEQRAFPDLRTLLFAGEVFPTKYLRQLMTLLPDTRFCNLYGPTETNVCTFYVVPPIAGDSADPIPIGRAIDDVEVFALRDDGTRAAIGETGELYVRGTTVMQGYWGDQDRTRRALVVDPLGTGSRDPAYRTGDLVVEDADRTYRLLGRRDHQIKSRGYRIELGEIESALYAHPRVQECAVVAVADEVVTNRIKAFVVSDDLSTEELLRFCAERIPHYMLPDAIDLRDALPKTSTGKVDRQALIATEDLLVRSASEGGARAS